MTYRVRVPATSANLGSGFDCVGIAVELYDELQLTITDQPGLQIDVAGEGAGAVPSDESHLVIASMLRGLEEWGGTRPAGLHLAARNAIPHARGLGSSAAAIVAGLACAWAISHPGEELALDEVARLSSLMEGHPDNAAAAVYGGAILAWLRGTDVELVHLHLHEELTTRVWIPDCEVPTSEARSVLPTMIPRSDAVAQGVAAATLPLALSSRPDLLWAATSDRIHQDYRAALMPASYQLLTQLRDAGVAATISGAGPSVLAVGTPEQLQRSDALESPGFARLDLPVGCGVTLESTSC